jgi:hypothetical protein
MRFCAPLPVLLLACVACSNDPKATEPTSDGGSDSALDSGLDVLDDMGPDWDADIVEAGDTDDLGDVPAGFCGPVEPTHVFVVSQLRFARQIDGVSSGFDLDDRASDGTDPGGCRKLDYESPDGVPGVDNQFALLLPAIEAAGGLAFEGLIQDAVNAGNILIMIEVESADDLADDECVSVIIQRGEGLPIVNRDDRIEGGQTFDRNTDISISRTDGAAIDGGVLAIDGVAFDIPAYVFTFDFLIPVTDGKVRMEIHQDGTATGVMGGGISVQALIDVVSSIDGAGGVPDAVTALAPGLADLFPDESGDCQSVSVALEIEAVPGFFYE